MTTDHLRAVPGVAKTWKVGAEVVVSRLDQTRTCAVAAAAKSAGAIVRWAEVDIETCELPEWSTKS